MSASPIDRSFPAPGWTPTAYVAPAAPQKLVTMRHVHAGQAIRTPQFYLLWWVLRLNVTQRSAF